MKSADYMYQPRAPPRLSGKEGEGLLFAVDFTVDTYSLVPKRVA